MHRRSRVTQQEIAHRVGCDKSTVSLALRGSPRISRPIRERIREVAAELGYRPDPVLSALSDYRTNRREHRNIATLAYLIHLLDENQLDRTPIHRVYMAGARAQAERLGYGFEVFFLGPKGYHPERLAGILHARGIPGVVLASFAPDLDAFELAWDEICSVKIGYHPRVPRTHIVAHNHFQLAYTAVRELRVRGYRRILLALSRVDIIKLSPMLVGGFLAAQREFLDPEDWIAPLTFEETRDSAVALAEICDDLVRDRVEVLLSNWFFRDDDYGALGLDRSKLRFCSLDKPGNRPDTMGMVQDHTTVGARAIDQLALLLKTNQFDLPEVPSLTLIDGIWSDGETRDGSNLDAENQGPTRRE